MKNEINKTRVKEMKNQLLAVFREIEETAKVLKGENAHNFRTEIAETVYEFKEKNSEVNEILSEADCMGPAHKHKTLSITGALYLVKDGDLLEYANDLSDIKSFINDQEPDRFSKEHQREWLDAKKSIEKLTNQLHSEFFERISVYSFDLEEGKTV